MDANWFAFRSVWTVVFGEVKNNDLVNLKAFFEVK